MTHTPANTPASGGDERARKPYPSDEVLVVGDALRAACKKEFNSNWSFDVTWDFAAAAIKALDEHRAALAAPTPQADGGVVPAGWRCVPEEPDDDLIQRLTNIIRTAAWGRDNVIKQYRWLIAAAPPLNTGPEVGDDLAGLSAREKENAVRVSASRIGMAIEAHKDDPGHEVYAKSTVYQWQAVLARITPASRPAEQGEPVAEEEPHLLVSAPLPDLTPAEIEFDAAVQRYWREHVADGTSHGARRAGLTAAIAAAAQSEPAAWSASYQATFNAIQAATRLTNGGTAISVSVAEFYRSLGAHPAPAASRPVEQGEPVAWQGCDPDEPYDPLKCAIWAALVPFQNELLQTGGVTFMGLRNSIVEAVRSFAIASQRDALAPAASRPAVGREEVAAIVLREAWGDGAWDAVVERAGRHPGGQAATTVERCRKTATALLALLDLRDDTRAGGDQAERRAGEIIQRAAKRIEELEAEGAFRGVETNAARDVLYERRRQTEEEGWTPEHDDAHGHGEMATAAACYAYMSPLDDHARKRIAGEGAPYRWPWHPSWWKPVDPRRDLVKAGALILAEIERLDRAPTPPAPETRDDTRDGGV